MGTTEHVRYWPRWAAAVSLVAGLLALLTAAGSGRTTSEPAAGPTQAWRTISGTVRVAQGPGAIRYRLVEIVNVESGQRHSVATNKAGAFTIKVTPGTYRVQVALRSGESVVAQPGIMELRSNRLGTHVDLVIGTVRLPRPRLPVYQRSTGLGAPVI